MFAGAVLIGLIYILWRGGWATLTEAQRITSLSMVAIGVVGLLYVVIVGMLVGGPVNRVKVIANKDGVDVEASGKGATTQDGNPSAPEGPHQ
jgi:hypothetical protein